MWNFPVAPEQASEQAANVDNLFNVITALTIFFTVVVLAFVVFFSVKYRVGSRANRDRPQHENLKIEIAWSLPPLLLGIAIFAWGAQGFVEFRKPPDNAMEIYVVGKQWMWHVQHPSGIRENNELHVPVGVPVKLTMISQDVLHAFYIPAFRAQYHVVPGRYTDMWFTPSKPGRYYLFCNMHCGTGHSEMGGYVYVMSQADYAKWASQDGETKKPKDLTLEQSGEHAFKRLNCANCHTGADTDRAPTLHGLPGKARRFTDGTSAPADPDYLRESMVEPYARIVQGYTNTMPAYKGQLTEEEILQLQAYMKTLGSPAATANQPSVTIDMGVTSGGDQNGSVASSGSVGGGQ